MPYALTEAEYSEAETSDFGPPIHYRLPIVRSKKAPQQNCTLTCQALVWNTELNAKKWKKVAKKEEVKVRAIKMLNYLEVFLCTLSQLPSIFLHYLITRMR